MIMMIKQSSFCVIFSGFLTLLKQLTVVGDFTKELFLSKKLPVNCGRFKNSFNLLYIVLIFELVKVVKLF